MEKNVLIVKELQKITKDNCWGYTLTEESNFEKPVFVNLRTGEELTIEEINKKYEMSF